MKCTRCNNKEANTHYKKVVNGKKEEMYLCPDCAKELGVMDEFSFDSFAIDSYFGNLLGNSSSTLNSLIGVDRCSCCGASVDDIISTGRIGCAECYSRFEKRLKPAIRRLHSDAKHIGKGISIVDIDGDNSSKIDDLKQELKEAVKEQRFEDAIVLRDKIKELSRED